MIKYYLSFLLALVFFTSPSYGAESENAGYQAIPTDSQKTFRAYVAGPQEAEQGLLLLHGWLGLNHEMEIWANQFAVQGYRVMAVDLYNNQVAKHPSRARKLMNSVNQREANEKFRAAIKMLTQNGRKVAVLGRSFGANQAVHAASIDQRISAVVLYYPFGDVVTNKNLLASISAPVLGNFASDDFFFKKEIQKKFVAHAKQQGINLKIENYSARHGFANIFGKNYDANADSSSSKNTFTFLSQHLH